MTTIKDLYGDDGDKHADHEACPDCGWCLVCDACMCEYLRENPDREAMRFPYEDTREKP